MPALDPGDSEALYDSRVICEYLDSLHEGAATFPSTGPPDGGRCAARRSPTGFSTPRSAADSPFLDGNDVRTLDIHGRGLGAEDPAEIGADPPAEIQRFGLDHWRPDLDGQFLSCTAWRAMSVVETLERATTKPVVTSNQATIWKAFQVLGLDHEVDGAGQLFREHHPLSA